MKRLLKRFAAVGMFAVTSFAVWAICNRALVQQRGLSSSGNSAPILEQIRLLSELTTLRVDVADAMETVQRGYTGAIHAVIIVHGEVTVGVDLSSATFDLVDSATRRAVLRLPRPQVESVWLDHERTRLLGVWQSGLWAIVPGESDADANAINDSYRDAQNAVSKAGAEIHIIDRARNQTEQVLKTFFTAIGWTVEVHWTD